MNAETRRVEARPTQPPMVDLLRYWVPVVVWMLCISMLSGDPFSANNTHRYIDPILRYLFPDLSASGFVFAHSIIRKTAHFVEFFVLGWLTYWALRRGRTPYWQLRWALQALAIAAGFSLLDELHQAFVPSRTGSLLDSVVDSSGALVAQMARFVRERWRSASVRSD